MPPEAKDVTASGIFEISNHAFGIGFCEPKHTPVQKRIFTPVILTIWPRFKNRGIYYRGKKVTFLSRLLTEA